MDQLCIHTSVNITWLPSSGPNILLINPNLCSFQRAFCAYCHDRIWGLGRQGFKCTQCKLLIHKKCHKLIRVTCDVTQVAALPPHGRQQSTGSGSGSGSAGEKRGKKFQAYLDVIYSNAKNELVIAQWFVGTIKVYYAYCHSL